MSDEDGEVGNDVAAGDGEERITDYGYDEGREPDDYGKFDNPDECEPLASSEPNEMDGTEDDGEEETDPPVDEKPSFGEIEAQEQDAEFLKLPPEEQTKILETEFRVLTLVAVRHLNGLGVPLDQIQKDLESTILSVLDYWSTQVEKHGFRINKTTKGKLPPGYVPWDQFKK